MRALDHALLVLCVVSAIATIVFGYLAATTPRLDNPIVYQAEFDALYSKVGDSQITSDDASAQFFELQNRHETPKWRYVDWAYAAAAWSLICLALGGMHSIRGWLLRTHGVLAISIIVMGATFAFGVGVGASVLHDFNRGHFPPWADSVAIGVGGAVLLVLVGGPAMLMFVAAPHLRRREIGGRLIATPNSDPFSWAAANLLYLPLSVACFVLSLISATDTGGWALSPALLMFAWLFVHARAISLAPLKPRAPIVAQEITAR